MKEAICGANCAECPGKATCKGCAETNGCPYGKQCFVASYILTGGKEAFSEFKQGIINEVNALDIPGMEKVTELYPLVGSFVNSAYQLPSGEKVRLLCDDEVYLGTQVADTLDDSGKSCYGVAAGEGFLLVCRYGENIAEPELVVLKSR